MAAPYAELHCHSHFSFLDGASAPDELVDRAIELGLGALALTDHQGLYGAVRFATAAHDAGLRPIIGLEIELSEPFAPDPRSLVMPARRPVPVGRRVAREDVRPDDAEGFERAELDRPNEAREPKPAPPAERPLFGILPAPRRRRGSGLSTAGGDAPAVTAGQPIRPRPMRLRLPGHRRAVKEDLRGIG